MTALAYWGACLFFGLLAVGCVWGAINGAWHREWKFAGGALILMLIFVGGAFQMYEGSQGRPIHMYDQDVPRIR